LLREYPSLQTIDGRAGDEGKDSFIGRFAQATHVFQIKYFDRIGPNQRRQIKESLEVASKQKPDKWTILLPTEFSKYDWRWFDELRKGYPSIQLDVWQSPQIEALVLDPKNDGLKDVFPELFPISTLLDWATKRVQKASMNATNQTASSLIERLAKETSSKDEVFRLLKESRVKQYSVEILAANRMLEKFNDEQAAVRTLSQVYEKATSEGDEKNELSALYGLLVTIGRVPEPDPNMLMLADRGIALAKRLGTIDALSLIESQKAAMLQSVLLARERRLRVTSTVLKTTGTLDVVLPFLSAEELALQGLRKEAMDMAKTAGNHAFESKDMRVVGTVIMNLGFSMAFAAFNYRAFGEEPKVLFDSANSLLEQARSIFAELGDEVLLAYAENNLALFWWMMGQKERAESHGRTALTLAKKTANRLVEEKVNSTLADLSAGAIPSFETKKIDFTPESQEEVIRFVVKQMGFDIEKPTDEAEKAIATGIKDLNPQRILRYCEYITVDQINTSLLGQMTGIPTIGLKRVKCTKFGHSVEGIDLDLSSDLFKKQRCETCPARKPRDPSWKWTFEWERSKAREHES